MKRRSMSTENKTESLNKVNNEKLEAKELSYTKWIVICSIIACSFIGFLILLAIIQSIVIATNGYTRSSALTFSLFTLIVGLALGAVWVTITVFSIFLAIYTSEWNDKTFMILFIIGCFIWIVSFVAAILLRKKANVQFFKDEVIVVKKEVEKQEEK
ncbi:hypothetical protein MBIO_0582 [Mycoplasmopsis fermentans PG18]|uniref:Transmembrane protein n=2 Tax=Mycoplasmopsis fermentans TaxID=2115 RepID=C4XFC5_MYCFP|nr:hypothetical protein MBIO_0582 [Mycoplasmopsis fermentans PG18]